MRVWWVSVWAVLGSFLAVTGAPARADGEDRTAIWRDPAVLARHLEAACTAVESVCGGRFEERPTVQVTTQEDLRRVLRGQEGTEVGMLETTPDEARRFLAYYEPVRHIVYILPSALAEVASFFSVPELMDEGVLRMILVHEATHALDFQRFPVKWALACCADSDERLATEAVLEGHAQLVTNLVARDWGLEPAFELLTRLYTGGLVPDGENELTGLDQDAAFTYIQGQSFMDAIRTERGRQGVDAVLRDPPFETRVLDRPTLWLNPAERAMEPDLQALLDVFTPLVPAPDWEVSKWRVLGPGVPMLEDIEGDEQPIESYVDNHGLYAGSPGGNRYFNVFIAYCATERAAGRFVRALRRVDEARDANPDWHAAVRRKGAGTDGKLEGFTSRRRAVGRGHSSDLTLQVVQHGRHVIEFSAYGLSAVDRKEQDLRLDLAARLLRSSPTTSAAVALRQHVQTFLTARSQGRVEDARELMRGLLPSEADLRRVVRPRWAEDFDDRYRGFRIALRTGPIENATLYSAFQEAAPDTLVRAWAASTEQLTEGTGWAKRFPPEMRLFCSEVAAPGMTWILLTLTTKEGEALVYPCFVRFGDRFLWVKNPWEVEVPR